MPYEVYKSIHLLGVMLLFSSLGALAIQGMLREHPAAKAVKKLLIATHGVAMVLLLVAGYGLLARLNMSVSAPWVIGKVLLWVALGAATILPKRMPTRGGIWFFAFIGLGLISAGLAIYKPGA